MSAAQTAQQRIFDAYVAQLKTTVATIDEVLVARLRYFAEDAVTAAKRIEDNPSVALGVVHALSTVMQQLDSEAGASSHGHDAISLAERFSLALPTTTNGEPADD